MIICRCVWDKKHSHNVSRNESSLLSTLWRVKSLAQSVGLASQCIQVTESSGICLHEAENYRLQSLRHLTGNMENPNGMFSSCYMVEILVPELGIWALLRRLQQTTQGIAVSGWHSPSCSSKASISQPLSEVGDISETYFRTPPLGRDGEVNHKRITTLRGN